MCSATIRGCSKRRPAPTSRSWCFRPTPTTARRWTAWPSSASARRWRPRRSSAIGSPAAIARSRATWRAATSRRCCRSCSSNWRAPTTPTPRWCCSIISSPICTAPARLLSLLRQNPDLIALIAFVLGIAPRLADTLARNPQVMDALVDPSFFGALPDDAELGRRLDAALAQSRYDEDLLERIRMFGLEYMFLIGVRILSGTVTARQAGEAFARLADAVIRAVHRAVAGNFAATHGHMRGEATAVLAMGKLGGREMTATLRSRPDPDLRFRRQAPGIGRQASALRRAIFRPPDPAADQCADRADQLWRALPGRHAAAPVGPRRTARHPDRRLHRAIRRARPGPGSTWRSRARAWSRPRRGSARGWRRSFAIFCSARATPR